ncbi:X-ray repair cross-complementing protein 5 isoform B [Alligator mississippiensis]|uniref:X-ray repair cross-complementing protein 5 n=1 Tax=Alligator mississippiensis TaxID=8496 RepID=A0A151M148_ALLMI|nr:X-ray repair cross-complementing protein 5 isoform B [Alligator mississippiensis]
MARGGSKAAIALCLDVGFSMSNSASGEESPFEQAKKVVMKFVQRQVFAESKDEVSLVLFGTDGTKNNLASGDQYQNITVKRHLMLPDFDLLEDIEKEIQPGSQQADFLDALVVCMDLLQKETVGKKYDRQHIEVFTDLSSPFSEDLLEIIIANLKKTGISLQFFLPFPVVTDEDESGAMGDSPCSDMRRSSFPRKGLTEQQKAGIRVVRTLMFALEEEGGLEEIYTFRDSLERLSMFKKIERRPMAWPCQLTIGSNLSIRIVAYKSITEEKVKKSWTVVDAKTLKRDDIKKETVYCLNDDDETEIQKEDIIQGFRYGSDIVPFSKVDEEQMKYKTEAKCFSVLGFSRSSLIRRHHYMGSQVLKVFAAKDDEAAAVAFSALVHALEELDMVAIVRYAYDRRSNPQVGVAFPCIKDAYECLMYVQLPYMEDMRQYMFASLKNNKKCTPTGEQLSAVDSLIDSMSLVHEDDDGETFDTFKTSKIPNPHFQRLYQCLHHKAFHPNEPLPPIEQHLLDMLQPPREVKERCQTALEKIKLLFPLKEAGKKKEQKTAQDIFKDNNGEGPSAAKAKAEDKEGSVSIANLAQGNVTSVGSINPAEDFRVLVKQKDANFTEVSQQLINRIDQFLESKGWQYYRKSIDCIQVFREEAIKLSEVRRFNDFLQALKGKVDDKALTDFWEIVIQDEITLITKDEAEGSTVTGEEAKKFLAPKEKPAEAPVLAEEGGDVDDLLDMMEKEYVLLLSPLWCEIKEVAVQCHPVTQRSGCTALSSDVFLLYLPSRFCRALLHRHEDRSWVEINRQRFKVSVLNAPGTSPGSARSQAVAGANAEFSRLAKRGKHRETTRELAEDFNKG